MVLTPPSAWMPVAFALECGWVVTTLLVPPPVVALTAVVAVVPRPSAFARTLSVPLLVIEPLSGFPLIVTTGGVPAAGEVVGKFLTRMPTALASAPTGAIAVAVTWILPEFDTVTLAGDPPASCAL